MTQQNQRSTGMIAAIAGGGGFLAFVLLMALFGIRFSPALLLGIVVAIVVLIVLLSRRKKGGAMAGQDGIADNRQEETRAAHAGAAPSSATAAAGIQEDGDERDHAAPAGVAPSDGDAVLEDSVADDIAVAQGESPDDGAKVKPSKSLAGEAELASRRGQWKYERDDAANETAPDAADRATAPSGDDALSATDAAETTDADDASGLHSYGTTEADPERTDTDSHETPQGVAEDDTTIVGTEPQRLNEPRQGGADDLKMIKGIGPKLEQMLNRMGFYHFDQIANWTEREIAWVDANLDGFKGRVSRDDWTTQAGTLAAGDETEFSRRAEY